MSENDLDDVWEEIERLSKELDALRTKRGILHAHLEELQTLGAELEASHAKVKTMAQEVEQHLDGPDES